MDVDYSEGIFARHRLKLLFVGVEAISPAKNQMRVDGIA